MTTEKKDCGNHCRKKLQRLIFSAFLTFIIIILLVILIIWLVLRPTKPRFNLQDAAVYQFNLTGPGILTTTLQVTLYSRNRMDRVGIYYDKLAVYASYHSQQITYPTLIPPNYQGHEDVTIWSPFLSGANIPVSPYLTTACNQDQTAGFIPMSIKIDGRLRWKVGTWTSGHYHINVNCPAYLTNNPAGPAIRLQQPSGCSVDV